MTRRGGRNCSWRWQRAVTAGPRRIVLGSQIAGPAADRFGGRFRIWTGPGVLCTPWEEISPRVAPKAGPVAFGGTCLDARWRRGRGAGPYGGRCIMSRSGVFYVVKAMERTASGTAAAGAARV